ncbi:UDP-GalNAc:beta-1,3-N-acetylgalactosaminyltransferase 1 isoform X3 [Falco peregrinus]|nr:UDP-GalNAc:beta-1,3-N-acetylgalactosaminyltransferase 1 isoform X3 [Falco peregrinus]
MASRSARTAGGEGGRGTGHPALRCLSSRVTVTRDGARLSWGWLNACLPMGEGRNLKMTHGLWQLCCGSLWPSRTAGASGVQGRGSSPARSQPAFPGRQQRGGTGTDVRDAEQVSHCQPTQLDFRTLIPTRIKASADQIRVLRFREVIYHHTDCTEGQQLWMYSCQLPQDILNSDPAMVHSQLSEWRPKNLLQEMKG